MRELVENIKNWAEVRGLKEQDPNIQWMRVTEEIGEVRARAHAWSQDNDIVFRKVK